MAGAGFSTRVRIAGLFVVAALVPCALICLLDLIMVQGPEWARAAPSGSGLWLGVWFVAAFAAFAGFFMAFVSHFGEQPEPSMVKPAILSALLVPAWLFAAITIVGNFHFLIGGHI